MPKLSSYNCKVQYSNSKDLYVYCKCKPTLNIIIILQREAVLKAAEPFKLNTLGRILYRFTSSVGAQNRRFTAGSDLLVSTLVPQ